MGCAMTLALTAALRPTYPPALLNCSIFYVYFVMIVSSPHYHATFAKIDFGYLLTKNFLISSNNKRPIPKAIGKNQCATGTIDVESTEWNFGTYKKKMAINSAKTIAGTRYQLKRWLMIDRRRVRSANRLNHCLRVKPISLTSLPS